MNQPKMPIDMESFKALVVETQGIARARVIEKLTGGYDGNNHTNKTRMGKAQDKGKADKWLFKQTRGNTIYYYTTDYAAKYGIPEKVVEGKERKHRNSSAELPEIIEIKARASWISRLMRPNHRNYNGVTF